MLIGFAPILVALVAAAPAAQLIHLPAPIERNVGQAPDQVWAQTRLPGQVVRLDARGLSLTGATSERGLRLSFLAGQLRAPRFGQALEGRVRELYRDHTLTIPAFERVTGRGPWPDVEMVLRAGGDGTTFDLVLAPGARADALTFALESEGNNPIDGVGVEDGALVVRSRDGVLTLSRPIAWQTRAGVRKKVEASWQVSGRLARIELGAYQAGLPVTVDPVIRYASYGPAAVAGLRITADASGVVLAATNSYGPPADPDLWVLRVDPTLTGLASLEWLSFVHGNNASSVGSGVTVQQIRLDANGRPLICGGQGNAFVSTDLTSSPGVPLQGAGLALVMEADGSLVHSVTAIGDSGALACIWQPGSSNFYVGGRSDVGIPTVNPISGSSGRGFLAWINADDAPGTPNDSMLWGTAALAGYNVASDMAIDGAGNLIVTFSTGSAGGVDFTGFVSAGTSFQTRRQDAGVCKFAPSLGANATLACTYLGGTVSANYDAAVGVQTDAQGNVYVLSQAASTDFPQASGLPANPGNSFAITRLSPDLRNLVWTWFSPTHGYLAQTRHLQRRSDGSFAFFSGYYSGGWSYSSCGASVPSSMYVIVAADGSQELFTSTLGVDQANASDIALFGDDVALAIGPPVSGTLTPLANGYSTTVSNTGMLVTRPSNVCTDLAISAQSSATVVTQGDALTWTAAVFNNGPSPADAVRVTGLVPARLQLMGATSSQGSCSITPALSCDLGTLANGATASVALTLLAATVGASTGSVAVATTTADLDGSNDQDTLVVSVGPATGPCGAVSAFPTCNGDVLQHCEGRGTANEMLVEVDCAAVGGTCSAGACTGMPDAGTPAGDSGVPVADAGNPSADGGGGANDAGSSLDLGVTTGDPDVKEDGGCGCSAAHRPGPQGALIWSFGAALWLLRRRLTEARPNR